MGNIHFFFRLIEAKFSWRVFFAILSFTFYCSISENTVAQTSPRYLGLTLTNDNNIDRLNDIDESSKLGMNAVQITIRWINVENDPNSPNAWQRFDAQVNKAKSLGMKIFLRIDMSNSCNDDVSGGILDNDACNSVCSGERMGGYITSTIRRQHWLGGDRKEAHSSLSAKSAINRMINFSNTVLDRYETDINNEHILWISCTTSAQQEFGFDWRTAKGLESEVAFMPDYSPSMIESFRTWLSTKYEGNFQSMKLNWDNWALQENGSSSNSFSDVYPPKPNRPVASIGDNFDNFKTTFIDHPNAGKDWYTFRHLVLKNYYSTFVQTVRNKQSTNLKIINEHGSVFDLNTILTGVFGFKSIGSIGDGIKVNTGPNQDHRFSMDIEYSNFPNKIIMDEVEYNQGTDMEGQFKEAFERGSTFETAKFDNLNIPGVKELLRDVAAKYVNGHNVGRGIQTAPMEITYSLLQIIQDGGCRTTDRNNYSNDCQAYKSFRAALGDENKAVNIILDESYLNSVIPITTTTSCLPPPCNSPQLTLSANLTSLCSGQTSNLTASGCSGTITWSNTTNGQNVGVGVYSATCTNAGCNPSSPATITISANSNCGGCTGLTVTLPGGGYNCGNKVLESVSVTGGSGNYSYNIDGCENSIAKNIMGFTGDAAKYVDYPFWWQHLTSGTHTLNVRDKNNALCGTAVLNITCASTATSTALCTPTCTSPQPTLSASSMSLCSGQTSNLTASGCSGTMTWTNTTDGQNVGIGTYTATCTNAGCNPSTPASITITTNSNCGGCTGLTVTLPGGGYNCGNKVLESVSVTGGSGNYSYNIDGCENSIAKNIMGFTGDAAKYVDYPFWWQHLTSGTHTLNVRDKNNALCGTAVLNITCANTSTPTTLCAGARIGAAEENISEEQEGVFIAPNPVNNILHYYYISDAESDEIQLQIFDMTGRSIKSLKQQKTGRITKGEISVESIMQGNYILNATDGIKKDAKRFIKE